MILFSIIFFFIVINFVIHVVHVQNFNATERIVDNYSDSTDVVVDIHPRGLATDSWEKNDAFPDQIINAKIYEATVTNNSKATLHNWSLRVDILDDCWLNNAWNGTLEIHQIVDGEERVQTLSLQNYVESEFVLDYMIAGQDLLIPLSEGDYFIYYPCTDPSISEEKIESNAYYNGSMSVGFIFYSLDGNVDLSRYELSYKLNKSVWDGTEPQIFKIALPIWIIIMLIAIIVYILTLRYEKQIVIHSSMTNDFLLVMADYVDSKAGKISSHSRKVAECAAAVAKRMGMDKQDEENVYYAALVHDIGKCNVSDYILKKKDSLTNEEIEQLKQHTVKGAEMLKNCTSIPNIAEGALYHHEKYDGSGYPTGKAGEDIPLIGRIIGLADSYEEMAEVETTHDKEAVDGIIKKLNEGRGTQFDPMLVDALVEILSEMDLDTWSLYK